MYKEAKYEYRFYPVNNLVDEMYTGLVPESYEFVSIVMFQNAKYAVFKRMAVQAGSSL